MMNSVCTLLSQFTHNNYSSMEGMQDQLYSWIIRAFIMATEWVILSRVLCRVSVVCTVFAKFNSWSHSGSQKWVARGTENHCLVVQGQQALGDISHCHGNVELYMHHISAINPGNFLYFDCQLYY